MTKQWRSSKSETDRVWRLYYSDLVIPSPFVIRHSSFSMAYLDQFLSVIVAEGGSDLHIGEGQPPKMRKHGDVAPVRAEPMLREETMSMLREVTGEHNWNIFEERGDFDFA